MLYLELFREQVSLPDGRVRKVNIAKLCSDWNTMIIQMLEKVKDPREIFAQFRFKTPSHMTTFREFVNKKLVARATIDPFRAKLKNLSRLLKQNGVIHSDVQGNRI